MIQNRDEKKHDEPKIRTFDSRLRYISLSMIHKIQKYFPHFRINVDYRKKFSFQEKQF